MIFMLLKAGSMRCLWQLREAGDALVDGQVDAIDVPPRVAGEEHDDLASYKSSA